MSAPAQAAVTPPLDELLRSLPPVARAELAWLPTEFRAVIVQPLREAQPEEFLETFSGVIEPGLRFMLRAARAVSPLLSQWDGWKHRFGENLDASLRDIGDRLEGTDLGAADALREAYAWLIAVFGAAAQAIASEIELSEINLEPNEEELQQELAGPAGSFTRGLLLTMSAYEALLMGGGVPPAIRLWSEEARREVHLAANLLRSVGLAVPTSLPAHIEVQAWRRRRRGVLFRPWLLPPGTKQLLWSALKPKQVWLFGSRAKGTYAPGSDWDVLAVVSDDTDVDELLRSPMVSMLRRRNIDLIIATESEFEEGKEAFGSLANIAVSEGIPIQ